MTDIRIAFVFIASINILLTILQMIRDGYDRESINAILGWVCAIIYAIK